jgi:hypothetical protein
MALYERSLKATAAGCEKLAEALKQSRYNKSSIGDFIQYRKSDGKKASGVSRATVAKAFNGDPVDRGIFIGLCDLLGLNWQEIAELEISEPPTPNVASEAILETGEPSSLETELIDSPLIKFLDDLILGASSKYSQTPEQEAACEIIKVLIFHLVDRQHEDYVVDEFFSTWNQEVLFKSREILIFEIRLKLLKNKRIHRSFLLSILQKIGRNRIELLVDIFLYAACRDQKFLASSRDYNIAKAYFDQDSLDRQKFTLLRCYININRSAVLEDHDLGEAQDLIKTLEINNFSTLWLTKIVVLAGYLEKIEIMESALNGLRKDKRDEDRRSEMEQTIDGCCIKINQYFVSSITGQGSFSEKVLRCPGYAHIIAHDSLMICKHEVILASLERMSQKWKKPLKSEDIKTRLQQFAKSCLGKAGTPFFDWMS